MEKIIIVLIVALAAVCSTGDEMEQCTLDLRHARMEKAEIEHERDQVVKKLAVAASDLTKLRIEVLEKQVEFRKDIETLKDSLTFETIKANRTLARSKRTIGRVKRALTDSIDACLERETILNRTVIDQAAEMKLFLARNRDLRDENVELKSRNDELEDLVNQTDDGMHLALYYVLALLALSALMSPVMFFRIAKYRAIVSDLQNEIRALKELALNEAVVTNPRATLLENVSLECAIPGSSISISPSVPKGQLSIMQMNSGNLYPRGEAFWIGNYLVTAAHVISGFEEDENVIFMHGDKRAEVEISKFKIPADSFDLAYMEIDNSFMQKLDMKKLKIVEKITGEVCATISAENRCSFGNLKNSDDGYVRYYGSTTAGFSGAPYLLAGKVVGMHLGAISKQTCQIGYPISVIMSILSRRGYQPEDSADYLLDEFHAYAQEQYHTGGKVRAKRVSDDVFQVYFPDSKGYHRVLTLNDDDTYDNIYEVLDYSSYEEDEYQEYKKSSDRRRERRSKRDRVYDDDFKPESFSDVPAFIKPKNSKGAAKAARKKKLVKEVSAQESGRKSLAEPAPAPNIQEQNAQIMLILESLKTRLDGLELTRAQRKEASPSTSTSSRGRPRDKAPAQSSGLKPATKR